MAKVVASGKRLQINKANTVIVAAIAISSFVVIFSLVAARALVSQRSYQSRVIEKKEKARDQLVKNIETTNAVVTSYKNFVGTSENVLGGNPSGSSDRDGDNARITLDALPSKYDFPALTTSLEKLLVQNGLRINSITGTDEEVSQSTNQSSNNPTPVEMPFEANVTGSYGDIQKLISVFERSIRPFYINSMIFSGSDNELQLNVIAKTYFQPQKDLTIRTEVVR